MPTYTYECKRCRKTYDIIQRITDSNLTVCPICMSRRFKKLISIPTIMTGSKTSSSPRKESVAAFTSEGLNCAMDPNFHHPSLGVRAVREKGKS